MAQLHVVYSDFPSMITAHCCSHLNLGPLADITCCQAYVLC
jgi:hypothetical protein